MLKSKSGHYVMNSVSLCISLFVTKVLYVPVITFFEILWRGGRHKIMKNYDFLHPRLRVGTKFWNFQRQGGMENFQRQEGRKFLGGGD